MIKTITTIFLLVTSVIAFGQGRLGATISNIKTEFQEKSYNLKSEYNTYGDYCISIEMDIANVFYYFKNDEICYLTSIIPKDQGALNYYVEMYNNRYVIISPTEWKMYTNDGIAYIKLIFPKEGNSGFIWTNK